MRVYLSYKQTGVDNNILLKELNFIKNNIEKLGFTSFIYYFDENIDLPASKLNKNFLKNIKESNIVLAYINYSSKSEGQLLELGMAYALGKKIIVLLNKDVKEDYYLVNGLGQVFEFTNLFDLDFKEIFKG